MSVASISPPGLYAWSVETRLVGAVIEIHEPLRIELLQQCVRGSDLLGRYPRSRLLPLVRRLVFGLPEQNRRMRPEFADDLSNARRVGADGEPTSQPVGSNLVENIALQRPHGSRGSRRPPQRVYRLCALAFDKARGQTCAFHRFAACRPDRAFRRARARKPH